MLTERDPRRPLRPVGRERHALTQAHRRFSGVSARDLRSQARAVRATGAQAASQDHDGGVLGFARRSGDSDQRRSRRSVHGPQRRQPRAALHARRRRARHQCRARVCGDLAAGRTHHRSRPLGLRRDSGAVDRRPGDHPRARVHLQLDADRGRGAAPNAGRRPASVAAGADANPGAGGDQDVTGQPAVVSLDRRARRRRAIAYPRLALRSQRRAHVRLCARRRPLRAARHGACGPDARTSRSAVTGTGRSPRRYWPGGIAGFGEGVGCCCRGAAGAAGAGCAASVNSHP